MEQFIGFIVIFFLMMAFFYLAKKPEFFNNQQESTPQREDSQDRIASARWIDKPKHESWGWGSTIALIFLFFCLIFPAVVFLIWRIAVIAKSASETEKYNENHDLPFMKTGCSSMSSMLHVGGHPKLPYQQRIVMGLDDDTIHFYNYDLVLLATIPVNTVMISTDVRHANAVTVGGTYTPQGSSFGTAVGSSNINFEPDTLRLGWVVNGQSYSAEFNTEPIDPLEWVTKINMRKSNISTVQPVRVEPQIAPEIATVISENQLKPDEKECPYCAEIIKKAAVKCRFCQSDLPAIKA